MFKDIFDLFPNMGLPDPRKNEEFRKFLMEELTGIEDGGNTAEQETTTSFESMSATEQAKFLQKAQKQVESNPSRSEKLSFSNQIIEVYQKSVDIKKILEFTPVEMDNLKELPLRR